MRCIILGNASHNVWYFQVLQCAEADSTVAAVENNRDLLTAVIRSLGDNSLGVVKVGVNTLAALCKQNSGLNAVFSNEPVTVLEEVMAKSDSCRFNVYEVGIYLPFYFSVTSVK